MYIYIYIYIDTGRYVCIYKSIVNLLKFLIPVGYPIFP